MKIFPNSRQGEQYFLWDIYVLDIYKKKYLSTAVASESETYQILDILGEIFLDQNNKNMVKN